MTLFKIEYQPHQHQQKFHESKSRTRLLLSGIRGGKTVAGTVESLIVSLEGKTPYFSAPNVGAVVAATYPMLRDVVLPEFWRFCPPELVREYNRSEMTVTLVNGSVILFRSADNPERLRGLDLNWFWIDEAAIAKKVAYDILLGRVAQKGGIGWLTTTPKGYNWLYDEVYTPWKEGDKDYDVIVFRSYDNPFFPKSEIQRLKEKYDPDFFQQELEAKFVLFAGLVYKDFNPILHVKELEAHEHCSYYIAGVDWGYTNPAAIEIIGVTYDDKMKVLYEWFEERRTIDQIADAAEILDKDYHIRAFYCDPSEPSFIEQFRRKGMTAIPANNEINYGINAIAEKLRKQELEINKTCKNLIREFQTYQYPETRTDKPIQEKPVKVDDHALDALRYAIATFKPYQPISIR